jgi:hypothetical protein
LREVNPHRRCPATKKVGRDLGPSVCHAQFIEHRRQHGEMREVLCRQAETRRGVNIDPDVVDEQDALARHAERADDVVEVIGVRLPLADFVLPKVDVEAVGQRPFAGKPRSVQRVSCCK